MSSKIKKIKVSSAYRNWEWKRGDSKDKFKQVYEEAWREVCGKSPPLLTGVTIKVIKDDGTKEEIEAGDCDDTSVHSAFEALIKKLNTQKAFRVRSST